MAENRQFGDPKNPKMLQFGDRTGGSGHCAQCEAMLTDALDGTLTAADQELFDIHLAGCDPCSQLLADARRGFAFLELLRHPAPEPPAALLERILAQTSAHAGIHSGFEANAGMEPAGVPGTAIAQPIALPGAGAYANVVPFRQRFTTAVRGSSFGQILLQPRLAMTAAMAFFSIALTMNLTGIRLRDMHASDLSPGSLKRDFVSARTRGVQYYEGLRVVYVLESRVHDLQGASDSEAPGSEAPGSSQPTSDSVRPGSAKPEGQTPAAEPGKNGPAAQPEQKKQPASRPAPAPGSSRRETPGHTLSLAAAGSLNQAGLNRSSLNQYIVANTCFNEVEGILV